MTPKNKSIEMSKKRKKSRKIIPATLMMTAVILCLLLFLNQDLNSAPTKETFANANSSKVEEDSSLSLSSYPEGSALSKIALTAQTNPRYLTILKNANQYPDELLTSLSQNDELLNFTLGYPECKGTSVSGSDASDVIENGVPLYLQWDPRWGYLPYGNSIIGLSGCGPTCFSMVVTALTKDDSNTPDKMAQFSSENGFKSKDDGTDSSLFTSGAQLLGLSSKSLSMSSEKELTDALQNGALLVCNLGPGDFTKRGHYIVIRGYENGKFIVNDPNSKIRSQTTWSFDRLLPQVITIYAISA
ncbi:MAG: C39 family peptidase [Clostridiales bacterium]|jgi:hypothetical protein|nr:C39 family peptidase [Clostridiales bacterium]MCI2161718.1 C39 family peptidase [Oscillospiraceae bacterium]MCI2021749.1 C39 family peptidase [Clostridiales bacterium]MCI2026536.1 C39 family peptidase [Clostridiales bacterium]MCI2190974.1 C39 family peptidase [Oscillospiraceae bacterium]